MQIMLLFYKYQPISMIMNYNINQLPEPSTKRIAFKVKSAVERAIRKKHPWVFEGGIVKQSSEGEAGDVAIVYDGKKNKLIAVGFYDPHSPVRIKILSHGAAMIDEVWFEERVAAAAQQRQSLLETDTNSYRLIYGENDSLSSLIADVYDQVLVIKLYSFVWLPYLKMILPILLKYSNCSTAVLRLSRVMQNQPEYLHGLQDGMILHGKLKQPDIQFKEHGLLFSANVIKGHKTGFFLDHRHNRKKVGALSMGKKVLDIFSYAGGFTVHALGGGASEVVSLDISAKAQEMAKKNVALNFKDANHSVLVADAFEGMQSLLRRGTRFDVIIVDPPSFAKRDSEKEGALNSYTRLARLAALLAVKGGVLLLASCSSRISADDFFAAAESGIKVTGRSFQLEEKTFHDIDHPVTFPEGAYLKAGYYRLDD